MLGYSLRRLGASVLLAYLVLTFTFVLVHLAPGDPSSLFVDSNISAAARAEQLRAFGLEKPLPERYLHWLGAAVRGDWGTSFRYSRPAATVLLEKLPATVLLVLGAVLVEYGVGIGLGVAAARRANTALDQQIRALSFLLFSLPAFFLALVAIELLTVRWPLFPGGHMTSIGASEWPPGHRALDLLHHLSLPAMTLGLVRCGAVVRYVRNGLLEILHQDYVRAARARGLSPARVLWVHALPNSLVPLVQRLGLSLPGLLGGSLVIEVIFSWPGIGRATFQAIEQRDYPVIMAATALSATLVIAGNLLADIAHAWLDPRIRRADG